MRKIILYTIHHIVNLNFCPPPLLGIRPFDQGGVPVFPWRQVKLYHYR